MFTCRFRAWRAEVHPRDPHEGVEGCLAKVGIVIDIHRGLRTSGASSAINEFNWSLEEAQIHGQWSKVDTLKEFYGKYDLERIRGLQKRMVIPMKKREKK